MRMENGAGLLSRFEPDPNDVVNPDWEALDEGKKFKFGPESLSPSHRDSALRLEERAIENKGCLYYVKPGYVVTVALF